MISLAQIRVNERTTSRSGLRIMVMVKIGLDILQRGARTLGLVLDDLQLQKFQRYASGLASWNQRLNLTSSQALADIERTHFLDSLALVPHLWREGGSFGNLVDVGSGAGFPGLVLKLALPSLEVTLIEATARKTEFLRWLADDLELNGLHVRTGRAEELGRAPDMRERFDVATARALGSFPMVLELTLPLVRAGGRVLAQRGREGRAEAVRSRAVAEALGGVVCAAEAIDAQLTRGERYVVLVDKAGPTPGRYPRKTGIPAKRPLA